MVAQSYEDLKGENRVNQFLQLMRGGCQEAALAFSAIVSSRLGYTTRLIFGLFNTSQGFWEHAWLKFTLTTHGNSLIPLHMDRFLQTGLSHTILNTIQPSIYLKNRLKVDFITENPLSSRKLSS